MRGSRFLLLPCFCVLCLVSCASPETSVKPEPATARIEEAPVVFRELVPGVWLHTSEKEIAPWGMVPTNGLVIEDGESAILVDTA